MIDKLRERTLRAQAGKLTEAECRTLYHDITAAIEATKARLASLDYVAGKPGPARAEALAKGVDAVLHADASMESCAAELEILANLRDHAHRAAEAAEGREAVPRAKAAVKALPAAIDALERTHAAYQRARAEAEALVSDLRGSRLIAARMGLEAAALSEEDFERLAAVTFRVTPDRVPGGMAHAERDARSALTGWRPEPRRTKIEGEKERRRWL